MGSTSEFDPWQGKEFLVITMFKTSRLNGLALFLHIRNLCMKAGYPDWGYLGSLHFSQKYRPTETGP
jgi:hypothetical protein